MTTVAPELTDKVTDGGAHPLDAVFYPQSVAVCGVVPTPDTVPYDIFRNILDSGFTGTLYPVAPFKRNIHSVRAYRYVVDIPDPVDLAVIVYPANVVDKALAQCGQKGVKAVIVISAGFREVGPKGALREQRIKEICAEHGIAMIGPNCLGVINTDPKSRLNASFARKMPEAGRIGFLSQSGALCTAVLDFARDKAIGFSKFVSFGNKAGVTEVDLLTYLHEDDQTDVILLYLEEITDGRALVEVARRVTRGPNAKPILAMKSGRTPQGARAAASHTGSLAGQDAVADAIFRESGILRVDSIEELFDAAILYAYQPMPEGNRVAIVTNAGGPGVMATDAAVGLGLGVGGFEQNTSEKLKASLPAAANIKNPVDVIGDARSDRYNAALAAVLEDPNVDQALVILTPQSMTDIDAIAEGIIEVHESATKPIVCSFMGAADVASGIQKLQRAHIPHYILPEWACHAMAQVQRIRQWRELPEDRPEALPVDREAAAAILDAAPAGHLPEDQALAVLKAYGLPVPAFLRACSEEEAVACAEEIGYPAVLRLVSREVVHKTEIGGVALDLADADAVRLAFGRMTARFAEARPDAEPVGVLVRGMIASGNEVILGAERDPAFGPVLMFGLGGLYVELFRDVTFAMAPISLARARRMVRDVKAGKLLYGLRGQPPSDIAGVEESLVRLGQLLLDFHRILELDVNPLIARPVEAGGNAVADVGIRLAEAQA
ncbi:MAG TPA: acetate--CoA ligase family protein [Phycisphaerae bacterium]|nr:acetate--CoA ligase family protein [Phycisphaerae bacterium]